MISIKDVFNKISSIGVTDKLTLDEQKRISASNEVGAFVFLISSPYIPIFYFLELPSAFYLLLAIPMALLILVFYLNFWEKHLASRLLLIFIGNMEISSISYFLGFDFGNHLFLIPAAMTPFIIFSMKDRAYIIGGGVFSFALMGFLSVASFYDVSYHNLDPQIARFFFVTSCFSSLTASIGFAFLLWFADIRAEEALHKLDRLKSRMFTNISHELRTPLTLMLSPMDSLLSDSLEELSPTQTRLLKSANRNGVKLLKLINNMLDVAKLDAGRVELILVSTNIGEFLREQTESFRELALKKGLLLNVDATEDLFVDIDHNQFEKVIMNLLGNAFKFTQDGAISVVCALTSDASRIRISVSDTGIGIPADKTDLVFERFRQVDEGAARRFEGSGVGLALSRDIMGLHHGSLEVTSEIGRGTTFSAFLPVGVKSDLPENSSGMVAGSGEHLYREAVIQELSEGEYSRSQGAFSPEFNVFGQEMTVLVVEDNPELREYLQYVLKPFYQVLSADNGKTGLEAATKHQPDLILSDVMMPEMDGIDLLEQVRNHESLRQTPFIFLTARSDVADRIAALKVGADDYLAKPFRPPELLLRIKNLLYKSVLFDLSVLKEREKLYANLHDYLGGSLTDLSRIADRLGARLRQQGELEEMEALSGAVHRLIHSYKECLNEAEDLRILKDDFFQGLELILLRRYAGFAREMRFDTDPHLPGVLINRANDRLKKMLYSICLEISTNDLKYGAGPAKWNFVHNTTTNELDLSMSARTKYPDLDLTPGRGAENIINRVHSVGGRSHAEIDREMYSLEISVPVNN